MGFIYKITNDKTNKMYIGQTRLSIEDRWEEHLHTAKNGNKNYLLYQAMRKCGIKHFKIEQIEECANNKLDEREKFWIKELGTYGNGYNMNEGGNSLILPSPTSKEIEDWKKRFLKGESIASISKTANFGRTTIINYLKSMKQYNLIAKRNMRHKSCEYHKKRLRRNVYQYTLKGEFIKKVSMLSFKENEREDILSCALGKRKSYKGNIYSFADLPVHYISNMYKKIKNNYGNGKVMEELKTLYKMK